LLAADWPGRALSLRQEYPTADPERRLQIVLDLPEAASEARDELLRRGLEDDDPQVQQAALRTATRVRATALYDAVATWLEGGTAARRALAAEALGALGDGRAAGPLTRALGDTDPAVRAAAVVALGRLGGTEADVVLFDRTNDPESVVRLAAVRVLGTLGDPRSVFALLGALQDAVPAVRVAAVRALGMLRDPRAVRGITGLLRDPNTDVASAAIAALAALGPDARDAAEALSPIALNTRREGDARSRSALAREALAALGRLGGPVARTTLVQALHASSDPNEARAAAAALEALGPDALGGLLDALPQLGEGRRREVVPLLGRLGGDEAARVLVGWLDDGSARMPRGPLLLALGETRSDLALHHLLRALGPDLCTEPVPVSDGPVPPVLAALLRLGERPAALPSLSVDSLADALGRCGPTHTAARATLATLLGRTRAPRAATALGPLLDDNAATVRAEAVGALANLPGAVSPLLLRALGDRDPAVRARCLEGLSTRQDPETAAALGARLRDPAPLDRAGAAQTLGRIAASLRTTHPDAARDAVETLRGMSAGASVSLRVALLDALAEHTAHPGVLELLLGALGDDDRVVQRAAVEAVGHSLGTLDVPPPAVLVARLQSLRSGPAVRDPALRAALSWALGHHATTRGDVADDLNDPRPEVAGSAAGALALGPLPEAVAAEPLRAALCTRATAGHPLVRVNAVQALAVQGWRCDGIDPGTWIVRERSSLLRRASVAWLRRTAPTAATTPRVLARCAASDPSPEVARVCRTVVEPGVPNAGRIDVRVEGPGGTMARGMPVMLVRPDGVLRWALTGPDGWVHARPAPDGRFTLTTPEALVADQ